VALFAVLVAGCEPKRAVTPPPTAPGLQRPAAGPAAVDPAVLQKEIQKREAVLSQVRARRVAQGGPRQAVLDAWILAVEDQLARLKEIQGDLGAWKPTQDAQERARRSESLAGRFLECLALAPLDPPGPGGPRVTEETRVSWEALRSAYGRGDCAWVLREHEAIVKTQPQAQAPTDVVVMRATCLGRTGNRQDAIRILEPLMGGAAQAVDGMGLNYMLANWLFEDGQLDKAGDRYQILLEGSKERDRWVDLAKLRLEQIRLRRGEVRPAAAPDVPSAGDSGPAAREPVAPGGAAERPPDAAASLPPQMAPPQVTAPDGPRPPQGPTDPSTHQAQTARLQEGQGLLANDRYEEAIRVFQTVEGTEYEGQARKGIQEAQDRYAESKRREAAALVLKAREGSPANRKANLVQALSLLQETNKKYPNNRYAPKIQQNIQDVTDQLRAVDPSYRP
jgi:hypothetical protein